VIVLVTNVCFIFETSIDDEGPLLGRLLRVPIMAALRGRLPVSEALPTIEETPGLVDFHQAVCHFMNLVPIVGIDVFAEDFCEVLNDGVAL
jgi:hypothetical protein